MAILLSASSIYLAQQLPEWTKEYEAKHAAAVPHDFATLEANIERAVLSEDPTTVTSTTVGMLPEGVPLIGMYPAGGTLQFNPNQETFECIAATPDDSAVSGSGYYWNNTTDWNTFNDTYHVVVTTSKAELEPAKRGNLNITKNQSLSGEYYRDTFSVRNNSTLTIDGRLTIHARTIFVEEGSSINADGKGWSGGLGNSPGDNGTGVGGGLGGNQSKTGNAGGDGGGGGGCGGNGGNGGENQNSGGNASDLLNYLGPSCAGEVMGSGGGGGGDGHDSEGQMIASSGGDGGSGGGYVCLDAAFIDISGNISACGANGEGKLQYDENESYRGGGGGGGSGGWIKIIGDNVNITGVLVAAGGNGGESPAGDGGGGGGGGIVEVFYYSPSQIKESHIDVRPGRGGNGSLPGNNGTSGIKDPPKNQPYNSTLFHYESGYLVSNMTEVPDQEKVGYDTNSSRTRYGNLTYRADVPAGTDIVLKVRTSMYDDMHDAMPWETCPPVANGTAISGLISVSDGHRYIQWRAELLTFSPEITPRLHWVNITYDYGEPVLARTSGTISYASQYLYYPNYNLVYAHGATIREQYGRAFMLFPPPVFVEAHETGSALTITAIDITGDESSVSGRMSATVQTAPQGAALLKPGLNYANITLNLTTAYRSAWVDWFTATCNDAGLSHGTEPGQYNITITPDALQVIFYGNETKPVKLWLKRAEARVKLTE
ncbi:MAG: hypothetical protein JW945_06530 [Methanomicrobia archaeon]|nr:hypothetical protein [Methanomicrobia archaeon]